MSMDSLDRRKVDIVVMTMLIIASIIILTNDNLSEGGAQTELGSLFLPRIVAGFIIIFSLFIGATSTYKLIAKKALETDETISLNGFLGVNIYVGIFILYWFSVPYIGFLIATPLVMLSVAVLLGAKNWLAIGTMSVVVPLLVFYGSVHFLRVYLPTWSLS
jgi:hypothetical protein